MAGPVRSRFRAASPMCRALFYTFAGAACALTLGELGIVRCRQSPGCTRRPPSTHLGAKMFPQDRDQQPEEGEAPNVKARPGELVAHGR
jgi:hypothetical protein